MASACIKAPHRLRESVSFYAEVGIVLNIIRQRNSANKMLRPKWARSNLIGREFHDQTFSRLDMRNANRRNYRAS